MSSGIIDWADYESGIQVNRTGNGEMIEITITAEPGETWDDKSLHRFLTQKTARAMSAALRLISQPDTIGTIHQQAEDFGRAVGQAVRQQHAAISAFANGLSDGLRTTDNDPR